MSGSDRRRRARRLLRSLGIAALGWTIAAAAAANQSAPLSFGIVNHSSSDIDTLWKGFTIGKTFAGWSFYTSTYGSYATAPNPAADRLDVRAGTQTYCSVSFNLSYVAGVYSCSVAAPDPSNRCIVVVRGSWVPTQSCAFDIEVK